ncbi:MAG: glycerol-3-phosphate 1-O-acyltransferase PlsY [Bacteroidetes bacterium]|nr:glycerol-3-phosphate 1-O-acyltransferase PlsY [Bacteroidota bacterium]
MFILSVLCLTMLAYLLGSIPSAVWVGQAFYGIDVRDFGSGNAGATNTFRVLGKKAGAGVLLMDVIKGFTAACLVNYLPEVNPLFHKTQYINLQLLFGLSAVLGHLFPVFAGFKGGKGIATLFGMLIAIHYISAIACLGIFIFILFATRFVSLSSISAAIMFPIQLIWIFKRDEQLFIAFGVCAALLVILTHRKNINRLLSGNENKARLLRRHYRNG